MLPRANTQSKKPIRTQIYVLFQTNINDSSISSGIVFGDEHVRHVRELRLLDQRITLSSNAIFLCVASAITVCVVVTLLFVAEMASLNYGASVSILFVLSMALLATGLVLFLIETRVAVRGIRIRAELLEREQRR